MDSHTWYCVHTWYCTHATSTPATWSSDTLHKSPRGASCIGASCVRCRFAAAHAPCCLFGGGCKKNIYREVLHSSHFLLFMRLSTKSVTPCAPTFDFIE